MINTQDTIIITNHFHESPVEPRIIYATENFLRRMQCSLKEIQTLPIEAVIKNWHEHDFVAAIMQAVSSGHAWQGQLHVHHALHTATVHDFTITPITNAQGDTDYYYCTTDRMDCKAETSELDNLFSCITRNSHEFKSMCEMSPMSMIRCDTSGRITYSNRLCQQTFALQCQDNIYDVMRNHAGRRIRPLTFTRNEPVTKIDVMLSNGKSVCCRYWPIHDATGMIQGFSMTITDVAARRAITQQLQALREA